MAELKTHINRKKLFGDRSSRVTTEELREVFREVIYETHHLFRRYAIPQSFKEKKDHGDVDIIAIPYSTLWIEEFLQIFGDRIVDSQINGQCHSFLLKSKIGRNVHVDVIVVYQELLFNAMTTYYSFNDLSAIFGVIARRRNYKYSTLGFYKRHKDTKGNNHLILLSVNLDDGLLALGFDPVKFHEIESLEDAILYVQSSPFFDHRFFLFDHMTQKEKKDYKRPNIQYMTNVFRTKTQVSQIEDDDYFVKKLFPHWMNRIKKKISYAEKGTLQKPFYNGYWMNRHFPLIQGSNLGDVLSAINAHYRFDLARTSENDVIAYVKEYLSTKD